MKQATILLSICALLIAGCTQSSTISSSPTPLVSSSQNSNTPTSSPIVSSSPRSSGKATQTARPQAKASSAGTQKTTVPTPNKPTGVSETQVTSSPQPTSAITTRTSSPAPTRTPSPAPTQQSTGTVTVSTSSITQTVNRSQESGGTIKLDGFTLTSQGATAYQISSVNQSTAFNTSGVSTGGGITPGTSRSIWLNLNSQIIPNGTYTQTLLVRYTKDGVEYSGPTVTYTITLEGSTASNKLTTSTQTVNETLSRASESNGSILGSGFSLTSNGADGYDLVINRPSNLPASHYLDFGPTGGSLSNGQTVNIKPYLSKYLPNGTYSGNILVRYTINHLYTEGPIQINYSLTLVD